MRAFGDALEARGWARHAHPGLGGRVGPARDLGRGPYVTLSTHLDTVPPFIPPMARRDAISRPRRVRRQGDRRGDGVRGGAPPRDADAVAMLFVVGEETTHDGAHAAERMGSRERIPSRRARERRANGEHARARHQGRDARDRAHRGRGGAFRLSASRALGDARARAPARRARRPRAAEGPAARRDDDQHRHAWRAAWRTTSWHRVPRRG